MSYANMQILIYTLIRQGNDDLDKLVTAVTETIEISECLTEYEIRKNISTHVSMLRKKGFIKPVVIRGIYEIDEIDDTLSERSHGGALFLTSGEMKTRQPKREEPMTEITEDTFTQLAKSKSLILSLKAELAEIDSERLVFQQLCSEIECKIEALTEELNEASKAEKRLSDKAQETINKIETEQFEVLQAVEEFLK